MLGLQVCVANKTNINFSLFIAGDPVSSLLLSKRFRKTCFNHIIPCSDTLSAPACFLIKVKCFAQPQHTCSPISASRPAGTGIGVGQFHLFCMSLSAQL